MQFASLSAIAVKFKCPMPFIFGRSNNLVGKMDMNATEYAAAHRSDFLAQLKEFLSIPSISTVDGSDDVKRAAEWVAAQLRQSGITTIATFPPPQHPTVFAPFQECPGHTTFP